MEWSGFALHFGKQVKRTDPDGEGAGGCLVMVDAVAPYHATLTRAMHHAYGKVPASGRPRITRYRPCASRLGPGHATFSHAHALCGYVNVKGIGEVLGWHDAD
ncbi:hypothetical protein GCM10023223_22430 [Stackebrandtia albiflava]|nr:hypothetical protein [Stackebrandtia albiflava]